VEVAIVVVLVPASEGEPSLRPAAIARLAELGITSVAVVGDQETVGLVVEGWAFDPARSTGAVVDALAGSASRARALHPVLEFVVPVNRPETGGERS
jgi:hypothetical protein